MIQAKIVLPYTTMAWTFIRFISKMLIEELKLHYTTDEKEEKIIITANFSSFVNYDGYRFLFPVKYPISKFHTYSDSIVLQLSSIGDKGILQISKVDLHSDLTNLVDLEIKSL